MKDVNLMTDEEKSELYREPGSKSAEKVNHQMEETKKSLIKFLLVFNNCPDEFIDMLLDFHPFREIAHKGLEKALVLWGQKFAREQTNQLISEYKKNNCTPEEFEEYKRIVSEECKKKVEKDEA